MLMTIGFIVLFIYKADEIGESGASMMKVESSSADVIKEPFRLNDHNIHIETEIEFYLSHPTNL